MKFAHMGDCHLGGWRQPELKELNFRSFQHAIKICIQEKVDFILIAGDLFDSAYPPIDILKSAFDEFRKIKEAGIPVFLIAGSHDYSASGKTFLDVLEKAGFCKNVVNYIEKNGEIILEPTLYKNIAIYGYPGKKSGLEVDDIEKIRLEDSPGLFKILMLHTALRDAVGNLMIKSVNEKKLPKVDYTALAHLHINYNKEGRVYCGPTFPNNLSELEELKGGSFYIFNNGSIRKMEIKLREVVSINMEMKDSLSATEKILDLLKTKEVKDKIVIIRLSGILEKGKISDVDFQKIESYLKEKEAYAFLKSTSKVYMPEMELKSSGFFDSENFEEAIIKKFEEKNPSKFNSMINNLMNILTIEKLDEENFSSFEDRLISEAKKVLNL